MKLIKKDKNFLKNNILSFTLTILLFFIFFQEFEIFRNGYYLISKDHDKRASDAYENTFFSGYCKGSSHGYLYYIKNKYYNKFKNNKTPQIINNFNKKEEYWIFLTNKKNIELKSLSANRYVPKKNEDQIIILNNLNQVNLKKYQIIDNYKNKCFFLEKK